MINRTATVVFIGGRAIKLNPIYSMGMDDEGEFVYLYDTDDEEHTAFVARAESILYISLAEVQEISGE